MSAVSRRILKRLKSKTLKTQTIPPNLSVRKRRRMWVRSRNQERPQFSGKYPFLSPEEESGEPDFWNFSRVFPEQFDALVELVAPFISRKNTNYRQSISVEERLMVTLRFLVTGERIPNQSHFFRMGLSTVFKLVPETCRALYRVLKDKYLKCPDSAEEWQDVARGFESQWDFPNCVGALDGRELYIRAPPANTESASNNKEQFSAVLMGLVDNNYRFLYADVGWNGRVLSSGQLNGCILGDALDKRLANIPGPALLPGSDRHTPLVVVADKTFPLKENLMKPYRARKPSSEQQVFNYRLSRASQVANDAFTVMGKRFRILQAPFNMQSAAYKIEDIVLTCCALHNFLCDEAGDKYFGNILEQEEDKFVLKWWKAALPVGTNAPTKAKLTRDDLCAYFISEAGAVPSQYDRK